MSYGLPKGTNITYGSAGFPAWVYQLGDAFGLKASTYPGHQETNRNEAGFAPNPGLLNCAIDWSGPVDKMQKFAEYCLSIKGSLEQVIWQNPGTGRRIGVAGGRDVSATAYYGSDYGGHTDHVHARQSEPIPTAQSPAPLADPSTAFRGVMTASAVTWTSEAGAAGITIPDPTSRGTNSSAESSRFWAALHRNQVRPIRQSCNQGPTQEPTPIGCSTAVIRATTSTGSSAYRTA
jgi:hypothetical protein